MKRKQGEEEPVEGRSRRKSEWLESEVEVEAEMEGRRESWLEEWKAVILLENGSGRKPQREEGRRMFETNEGELSLSFRFKLRKHVEKERTHSIQQRSRHALSSLSDTS